MLRDTIPPLATFFSRINIFFSAILHDILGPLMNWFKSDPIMMALFGSIVIFMVIGTFRRLLSRD